MASKTYDSTEVNNRQAKLFKDCSKKVCIVIGVGGIGSWVAVDLALLGIKRIILFDSDEIESSNLNRTLFKIEHVGKRKTDAVKSLIDERRPDVLVTQINQFFDIKKHKGYLKDAYIFDCTDNNNTREALNGFKTHKAYTKLGYDGFDSTIVLNEFDSGSWGKGETGYTVIPSFFGTPQLLADIAIIELLINENKTIETISFSITDLLNLIKQANFANIDNGRRKKRKTRK